ncbi:MAG: protease modulator HflC [SAR202 cluster bacterium]|nr:protease modulator HflC [SAR202 cluster bacterium]MQG78294.1 protease modulator HflC [SAR202 cluster bacterium]|tara:strand:- start:449 stop:1450 length:1002 start_codon:yes stop_codon:yes gene_type:complete
MRNLVITGVLVILALIVITQSLFVVQETEQVVVTRFGDVQSVHTSPGLYFKAPFVDSVINYDRRLLRIDAPPSQFLDRDINILEIDVYGRFRINDPRAFLQTLTTEENARSILAQRINSSLRAEVAERSREEIIGGDVELDESGEPVTDDEGNSRVQPTNSRTELLQDVIAAVQANLAQEDPSFGVEMIDIRVKRADFPQEVAGRIFERMRSDREKISRRLRAEGEEEARTRRAAADRDVEVILAGADRDASRLRGDGEAQAISILAESLNKDPEFFSFRRSLDAYKAFLNQRTTVILSSDAPIFRFLQSPGEGSSETTNGQAVTDPLGLQQK